MAVTWECNSDLGAGTEYLDNLTNLAQVASLPVFQNMLHASSPSAEPTWLSSSSNHYSLRSSTSNVMCESTDSLTSTAGSRTNISSHHNKVVTSSRKALLTTPAFTPKNQGLVSKDQARLYMNAQAQPLSDWEDDDDDDFQTPSMCRAVSQLPSFSTQSPDISIGGTLRLERNTDSEDTQMSDVLPLTCEVNQVTNVSSTESVLLLSQSPTLHLSQSTLCLDASVQQTNVPQHCEKGQKGDSSDAVAGAIVGGGCPSSRGAPPGGPGEKVDLASTLVPGEKGSDQEMPVVASVDGASDLGVSGADLQQQDMTEANTPCVGKAVSITSNSSAHITNDDAEFKSSQRDIPSQGAGSLPDLREAKPFKSTLGTSCNRGMLSQSSSQTSTFSQDAQRVDLMSPTGEHGSTDHGIDHAQIAEISEQMRNLCSTSAREIPADEAMFFVDNILRDVHPKLVKEFPAKLKCLLKCVIIYLEKIVGENLEHYDDNTSDHIEYIKETIVANRLWNESNAAFLEITVNAENRKLRDEVVHLKILIQNLQRDTEEIKSMVSPKAQVLHKINRHMSAVEDRELCFIKTMEYYMYKWGIQFEKSPVHQAQGRDVGGGPPIEPVPPPRWPVRSVEDRQRIIRLQNQSDEFEVKYNLQLCENTGVKNLLQELEEQHKTLVDENAKLEAEYAKTKTLMQEFRRMNIEFQKDLKKPQDDSGHMSITSANAEAFQYKRLADHQNSEAARAIALKKRELVDVKQGHALEKERLREEISDLQNRLMQKGETVEASPSRQRVLKSISKYPMSYSNTVKTLTSEMERCQGQVKSISEVNVALMKEKTELQLKVDDLVDQLDSAACYKAEMDNEIGKFKAQVQKLVAGEQCSQPDPDVQQLQTQIADLKSALEKEESTSRTQAGRLMDITETVANQTSEIQQLSKLSGKLKQAKIDSDKSVNDSRENLDKVQGELNAKCAEFVQIQAELEEAQAEILALNTELALAKAGVLGTDKIPGGGATAVTKPDDKFNHVLSFETGASDGKLQQGIWDSPTDDVTNQPDPVQVAASSDQQSNDVVPTPVGEAEFTVVSAKRQRKQQVSQVSARQTIAPATSTPIISASNQQSMSTATDTVTSTGTTSSSRVQASEEAADQTDIIDPRGRRWEPPDFYHTLQKKSVDKPFVLMIGDSLIRPIPCNTMFPVCENKMVYQPHMEAITWELGQMYNKMAQCVKRKVDRPGLDVLIISTGTNDVANLHKFFNLENEQANEQTITVKWPKDFDRMMKVASHCLDPDGRIFLVMPAGRESVSNETSGITAFRDMVYSLAVKYPHCVLVDNSDMINEETDRVSSEFVIGGNNPHLTEEGRKQYTHNIRESVQIHLPHVHEYVSQLLEFKAKSEEAKDNPAIPAPRHRRIVFERRSTCRIAVPGREWLPSKPAMLGIAKAVKEDVFPSEDVRYKTKVEPSVPTTSDTINITEASFPRLPVTAKTASTASSSSSSSSSIAIVTSPTSIPSSPWPVTPIPSVSPALSVATPTSSSGVGSSDQLPISNHSSLASTQLGSAGSSLLSPTPDQGFVDPQQPINGNNPFMNFGAGYPNMNPLAYMANMAFPNAHNAHNVLNQQMPQQFNNNAQFQGNEPNIIQQLLASLGAMQALANVQRQLPPRN